MEYDNYIQKLSEISNSLSKLPDYTQSPEFKKAIENTSKIASLLANAARTLAQSEAMQAFYRMAEQINGIKMPTISKDAIKGFERYNILNKLEDIQWPLYFVYDDEIMRKLSPYSHISEDNAEEIRDIVFQYCTSEFIENLLSDWENQV